jgi:hypothetical protein
MVRLNSDVEPQGFIPLRPYLNMVRPRNQIKVLEVAVEFIDDTGVIAVDEHIGVLGLDPQSQAAAWTQSVEGIGSVPGWWQ